MRNVIVTAGMFVVFIVVELMALGMYVIALYGGYVP